MIQFFIKMSAVIAAAYFAVTLPEVGGLHGMIEKLSQRTGPGGINYLNMLPDFSNQWDIAMAVFIMPIAVQWWAVWYPGSEPGGGSFIAQRMLASKSERDSLGSVLFFNVAHYCLRPWPWIIVALCSIIIYPEVSDIQKAFPNLDPSLLGHDIAYPAMLKCLPVGWIGLMVAGLIAANSSTILTMLNWGASYLVHDFYRRFLNRTADERHYVKVGRLVTIWLFLCASALTFVLGTAKDSFDILLQVGAGTGLLYLLRWFWWRINAWCEVVAMISSFLMSVGVLVINRVHGAAIRSSVAAAIEASFGHDPDLFKAKLDAAMANIEKLPPCIPSHQALILTVIATTLCWVAAAYLVKPTDEKVLMEFYRKVRPFGPGWQCIREKVCLSSEEITSVDHTNIPLALAGWVAGSTVVWSALFCVGNYLYGRMDYAVVLGGMFLLSGWALIAVMKKLWAR
jgi:Na+/proline symporter